MQLLRRDETVANLGVAVWPGLATWEKGSFRETSGLVQHMESILGETNIQSLLFKAGGSVFAVGNIGLAEG